MHDDSTYLISDKDNDRQAWYLDTEVDAERVQQVLTSEMG